ncbi:MAG: hypothetical protein PHY31_00445 [Smithellaceae bacterium]|nr:hypothetical protein [Smithellaceae bacterium]
MRSQVSRKPLGMTDGNLASEIAKAVVLGFIAGFCATLIFHQLSLEILWLAGISPFSPFSMVPTKPFGVPAVISLSFWGGVWGIVLALIHGYFPERGYWLTVFIFGGILPSLVALFMVLPMKGQPMGGGWHPTLLLTAFVINGLWGVGTAIFLRAFAGASDGRSKTKDDG